MKKENKYKGLSLAQINHLKKNKIKEFEIIGDIADFDHDLLQYTNQDGELITIFSTGEVYKD